MKIKEIKKDGKNIKIIGTKHMDQESVDKIKETIESEKPDTICIGMCNHLSDQYNEKDDWGDVDIFKIIKKKKLYLLLYRIIAIFFEKRMKAFYKKEFNVDLIVSIGDEKRQACESAEAVDAKIELLDRDMRVNFARLWTKLGKSTFNRYERKGKFKIGWGKFQKSFDVNYSYIDFSFGWWKRIKFLFLYFYYFLFFNKKLTPEKAKELREGGTMLSYYYGIEIEELWIVLLAERARIMAERVMNSNGKNIVVVVGQDHADVIYNYITDQVGEPIQIQPYVPPKITKYILAGVALLGVITYFVYSQYGSEIINFFDIRFLKEKAKDVNLWVFVNMVFGFASVVALRVHIVTLVLVSIISPVAMALPLLGTGTIAVFTEAFLNKPTAKDFDQLYDDVKKKRASRNRFSKLILIYLSTTILPPLLNLVWLGTVFVVNFIA